MTPADLPTEAGAETLEPAYRPRAEESAEVAIDPQQRRMLVIGEALMDVVRHRDGSVSQHPGGSPANVALGLARLGRGVDLLTWIGQDERGRALAAHLAADGVALLPGSDTADHTSAAFADLAKDGSASYEFDVSWGVPQRWTSPPQAPLAVHTGSIAAALEPGYQDVLHILAAHRESATITYDPNLRPALLTHPARARDTVAQFVALADVVKASVEDLDWLQPNGAEALAEDWVASGPALVVITRGAHGATALTPDGKRAATPAIAVQVVDTVGAGDAFMAALIDGLWAAGLLGAEQRGALAAIEEAALTTVLARGARAAAITVGRPGADPPSARELDS